MKKRYENTNNPVSIVFKTLQRQQKNYRSSNMKVMQYSRVNQSYNSKKSKIFCTRSIRSIFTFSDDQQCPFDFPSQLLLKLDNKVFLHEYLSSFMSTKSISFWPEGYIFPKHLSLFKEKNVNKNNQKGNSEKYDNIGWMLKEPAAYGSQGNQIVSAKEASSWHAVVEVQKEKDRSCARSVWYCSS